jgi:hypothetical protein
MLALAVCAIVVGGSGRRLGSGLTAGRCMCSNPSKSPEKLGIASTQKYGCLREIASSRNLQQTIVLPSHGRGRWFEPSIVHL